MIYIMLHPFTCFNNKSVSFIINQSKSSAFYTILYLVLFLIPVQRKKKHINILLRKLKCDRIFNPCMKCFLKEQ